MLSSSIFSQTTSTVNKYPKTQVLGQDTVICFTIPQARELAKIIVTKKSQDTIIETMQHKDSLCLATVNNQQKQIENYKTQVENHKTIDSLRTGQIDDLEKVNKLKDKEIKKEKRKRRLVIVGSVVAEILTITLFVLL
jgi:hypothetical protein